jgi:esterase
MKLFSKILGQGPPIIVLHGLMGTLDNWQTIANQLSTEYTVCLLDIRNHGRSPHSAVMTMNEMADDVAEWMADNWIHSAAVMGHSMGGKVAMTLALEHPLLVEKLMVVDISPKQYPSSHLHVFEALLAVPLATLTSRKIAENILNEKLNDPITVQFLMKNLHRDTDGHYHWKMNLASIISNYDNIKQDILGNPYDEPTWFVRGGNSQYVLDSDIEDIHTVFPNAKLITIDNAGHWVHADAPDKMLQTIQNFMKQ